MPDYYSTLVPLGQSIVRFSFFRLLFYLCYFNELLLSGAENQMLFCCFYFYFLAKSELKWLKGILPTYNCIIIYIWQFIEELILWSQDRLRCEETDQDV